MRQNEKNKDVVTVAQQTDKDPLVEKLEKANKEVANLKLKMNEKEA